MQSYFLKIFDTELATFEFGKNDFGETVVSDLEIDKSVSHLLPLNMLHSTTSDELMRFIKARRIPSNRAFSDIITKSWGLELNDTKGIIDATKGTSINDSYSIVSSTEKLSFADYNLFDNEFDEILSLIAYSGNRHLTSDRLRMPSEFVVAGSYPKTVRKHNGELWLYKSGDALQAANTGLEPYSEFLASQLADYCGIAHVDYELLVWNEKLCTRCKILNDKETSFVPFGLAMDAQALGAMNLETTLEYFSGIGAVAQQDFINMAVFDALIANPDRHLGNFAVMRDNSTGEVLGLSPLYDHNLALYTHVLTQELTLEVADNYKQEHYGIFPPMNLETQGQLLYPFSSFGNIESLEDFKLNQLPMLEENKVDFSVERINQLQDVLHRSFAQLRATSHKMPEIETRLERLRRRDK